MPRGCLDNRREERHDLKQKRLFVHLSRAMNMAQTPLILPT